MNSHSVLIVGLGPGSLDLLTERARAALLAADVVVGYSAYLDLIAELVGGKEQVRSRLTEEVDRAQVAVDIAASGRTVAVVSSGDAGVYGMAGLVFEVLADRGWRPGDVPNVEVIPGVSAAHAAASLLGAPLMHDLATVSLSDLLTPWDVIERRLEAAAAADFVIAIYNPTSVRRREHLQRARKIILRHRSSATPVGVVRNAYRADQSVVVTDLAGLADTAVDMLTIVIVGSSTTFTLGDRLVTPRGYATKYTLNS